MTFFDDDFFPSPLEPELPDDPECFVLGPFLEPDLVRLFFDELLRGFELLPPLDDPPPELTSAGPPASTPEHRSQMPLSERDTLFGHTQNFLLLPDLPDPFLPDDFFELFGVGTDAGSNVRGGAVGGQVDRPLAPEPWPEP